MTVWVTIARYAVLIGFGFLYASNAWAVPYKIEAQNGVWSGFGATQIHQGATPSGGSAIYQPLVGTLTGDLAALGGGGYQLSGVMGDLIDSSGINSGSIVRILDGFISDGASVYASGYFDYEIIGGANPVSSGTFTFYSNQSANFLTGDTLQLWGGDSGNGIGMDFRAELSPDGAIPEPATILLFASGVAGIILWGLSRRRVGIG